MANHKTRNSRAVSANTPIAPPAPPEEGTANVEEGGKKRRGRATRPVYPVPEGKLTEWPSDYDPNVHAKLKPADFVDEVTYMEGRAGEMERQAAKLRERASVLRAFGSVEDRERACKIQRLQEQLKALEAQMAEQGLDPEVLKKLAE